MLECEIKLRVPRQLRDRQVNSTDQAIDALVYQLYGLTKEEIKIVEGRVACPARVSEWRAQPALMVRRSIVMKDNPVYKFTCGSCGGHTLIVTHVWSILAGEDSERWQEWGPLKDNHHWQYQFKEQIEENPDAEVQRVISASIRKMILHLNRKI